jgi:2-oxoglutarate/2-oxoacid ferredoxin oxidoreductase subunit beta
MLARIYYPDFPVPIGVIRNVPRPTLDELIDGQLRDAVARRGKGDIQQLLGGGETWTIE